jgi:hypothetical protein
MWFSIISTICLLLSLADRLKADRVTDAFVGEAGLGRSRELLLGRRGLASLCGVGLAFLHEAGQCSPRKFLVNGLALAGRLSSEGACCAERSGERNQSDPLHIYPLNLANNHNVHIEAHSIGGGQPNQEPEQGAASTRTQGLHRDDPAEADAALARPSASPENRRRVS